MLYTDQIGHQFELSSTPKRIISLVPSQTELLFHLGLDDDVVGITKFCIHPKEWFNSKNRVGGTKTINIEKIIALKPDFIIANKEENTKIEVKELQKMYPVYTSDISNLSESLEMIQQIGEIISKENESKKMIENIQLQFNGLAPFSEKKNKVLYLIWKDPYMSVNHHTFISDMLKKAGFHNVIEDENVYPVLSEEQITELNPDFIFLSSEPYPFKEKHLKAVQKQFIKSKIVLVDGEYFSWYGSRLLDTPTYLIDFIDEI